MKTKTQTKLKDWTDYARSVVQVQSSPLMQTQTNQIIGRPTSDIQNTTPRQAKFEDLYRTDPVKACREALKATPSKLVATRDRLEAINDLLGLYGVEAIRGEWQNGYWCDIVACYCNTGDTYAITIIEVRTGRDSSRFIVSTMGDFVERNGKKLSIQ